MRDMEPQNSWTIGARERKFPTGHLRSAIGTLLGLVPLVDLWPFRETGSFTLREGEQAIAFDEPAFHERYDYTGTFPEASFGKKLRVRFMKAFLGFIRPLV